MASALGLNEHHQSNVIEFIRFTRQQRGQRLHAVDRCFEDLKDSRLMEDTFTVDEVSEMLDGLLAVVRGEVESELINTSHINVLLLRQMFQQAEKWHLKLQADISELENRELLEQIADFEEMEFSGTKRDTEFGASSAKLQPLNESGGAALLHMEIDRLKEENEKLKSRLKQVESKAIGFQEDKKQLEASLKNAAASPRQESKSDSGDMEALERQMKTLKSEMEQNLAGSKTKTSAMEGDLTDTKHELLRVKDMLDMAEKELEKKVAQTTPYKNIKQMLQKKNEQLKDLRKRLSKYESDD